VSLKRIFSRIGRVDFEGTTPLTFAKAFCSSLLETVNFIPFSFFVEMDKLALMRKNTKNIGHLQPF
jgi:hypothetical protein